MKRCCIILIALCSFHISNGQTCLPEGINFTTQSQIDSFLVNYPYCDHIKGNVTIQGADITNLNGLKCLSSLGGDLVISDNPVLASLTGLSALKQIVRGNLLIQNNPMLVNLAGFDSLTFLAGDLTITFCDGLISLAALGALSFTGGSIIVCENNSLTGLLGLGSLSSVNYCLLIDGNDALNSLTGLNALDTIWGNLWIVGNHYLTSLSDMNNLTTLCGQLSISCNTRLKSLKGLDNINSSSIFNLYICDNDSLSDCEVQSICNYLACPNGRIEISNNAPGCKTPEEVEANCMTFPVDEITNDDAFSLYPNPVSDYLTIKTSAISSGSQIYILNLNSQQLIALQHTGLKTQLDVSNLPNGVYFVRVTGERTVQVGKFMKQ